MEQASVISPEITFEHHQETSSFKKRVIKTTIILSIITLIELALGFTIYLLHKGATPPSYSLVLFLKGVICILTMLKAYYIVSVFMHLGDELKRFIVAIILPMLLFVWFIIAFLWDGSSYRNLNNTYNKYFYETTMPGKQTIEKAVPLEPAGKQ
ncbi:MAG TPA: cytochrome C oxidase subunit IV family protein [Niabella sp.]|jgi:cytochrome c oxidase subunit 4|nr:cytochrome C oxidase subunit IV family protein [Chitinophagaceae bacterium]HRN46714.1 cytochrome C oxidase subunit IV family protein [Niabella sp.]HRO83680.1 cytochrome C oxidase subunit IV family protein [Niabella sp.]HUN02779.1 cytochrome C oxidase subunit IV family protein [Niabella sp.]